MKTKLLLILLLLFFVSCESAEDKHNRELKEYLTLYNELKLLEIEREWKKDSILRELNKDTIVFGRYDISDTIYGFIYKKVDFERKFFEKQYWDSVNGKGHFTLINIP